MKGPLRPPEAKRLARAILEGGSVIFTSHAKAEMAKEKPELTAVDCVNVLRAGTCSEAEWENGAWRHHARTPKIEVSRSSMATTSWSS